MNRRAVVLGAAARLVALGGSGAAGAALVGCGPAGNRSGTAAEATVPVQVLDAWGPGPWTERLYADWSAQLAAKYPRVAVEFVMTPEGTSSVAKTTALLAAGTPPDVTLGSDLQFAFGGNLRDLGPVVRTDKEFASWQWNPPSWEYANITLDDGKPMLWAMPGNSDARVIYANLDLLAREGIPYTPDQPWSWDEFQLHARTLTKRRPDGTFEQVGFNGFGTFMGDLHVFASYAGGDLFRRDARTGWVDRATFNAPQTLEATEFFTALAARDRVGLLPGEPTAGLRFQDGTVALQPSWSSFFSSLNKAQPSFKWDLLGYPVRRKGDKWPNQFANGSQMGSILKDSKQPDPAYTVLKYLAGPEGHLIRQRAMGAPPSIMNQKALWDEWLTPPPQQTHLYQKIMASGRIGPWSKIKAGGAQIATLYADELKKLLAGESSPRQFADRITDEGGRLLASGGA